MATKEIIKNVVITDMTRAHLDDVLWVEHRSFPNPWTRSAFLSHLEHPEFAKYMVAQAEGRVVGYVGLFFGGGQGQITNLAVDPDYRNQGIGSRLLLAVIDYSRKFGIQSLSLEVRVSNMDAQRLYQEFGFVYVGRRRGYYQESGEDAFVMCLFDLGKPEFIECVTRIRKKIGADSSDPGD